MATGRFRDQSPAPDRAPGAVLAFSMLMKADPSSQLAPAPADEGVPVSVKIRERLLAARKRFHANDNIAEFIQPGEVEALLDEVERHMQKVLDSLVIDTQSDHNT